MSDKPKMEVMKEAFGTWIKLALTRIGVASVGVTEDKRESLDLLLEAAFEAGFSVGGCMATRELMNDLTEHVSGGKNGKVIVADAIPMPGVGHA